MYVFVFYVIALIALVYYFWFFVTGRDKTLAHGMTIVCVIATPTFWLFFAGGLLLRCLFGGATAYFHGIHLDPGFAEQYLEYATGGEDPGIGAVLFYPFVAYAQACWWSVVVFFGHNSLTLDISMAAWLFFMNCICKITGALIGPVNPGLLAMDESAVKAWNLKPR